MAFDPDAYLASAPAPAASPAPSSFDPDAYLKETEPPKDVSRLESLGRGAAQGATLGFADELAGILGAAFGSKKGDFGERYRQERDESRANFQAAQEAHPGFYLGGELAGGIAPALIPGGAAAEAATEGSSLGKLAVQGVKSGLKYGAAQGLGDSTADLTKGDFAGAIKDTLLGAGLGAAAGAVLHPAATKLLEGAPERAAQNVLDEIAQGSGEHGGATVTAKKLLAKDKDDIVRTVNADPELARAISKPAKEALPVVNAKMEQVGSQLDPLYQTIDKSTGGVSALNLTDFLNNEIAELEKKPLNEQYVRAVADIRDSILKAYAPDLKTALARDAKLEDMGLEIPQKLRAQDVMIPTRDLRAVTTRLQTRGSQVINPLNPGEASQMKADMASMMKRFLDSHLDVAAENGGPEVQAAVDKIRNEINPTYSALANIQKAMSQRLWKEETGSKSMTGHLGTLGTVIGGGLGMSHGGPIGMIAGAALSMVAPRVMRSLTHEGNAALAKVATAAAAGEPTAQLVAHAIKSGVPREVVMRVVSVASNIANAGRAQ